MSTDIICLISPIRHKIGHFGDVPKHLSYQKTKPNITKACTHRLKQPYNTKYTQTRAQQLLRWVTVLEQWAKKGAAVPLSIGRAGSPSNTMSLGPRPISIPSDILIHPAVWPQQT